MFPVMSRMALLDVVDAAREVLSPCDDSEDARGYCVGHGLVLRLPCEFATLRAALDALENDNVRP